MTGSWARGIIVRHLDEEKSIIVTVDKRISLTELKTGQELQGTVRKVTLSGAIVDIGARYDGLLHISALGEPKVNRTSDRLKEGQSVTVFVKSVDENTKRLSLTMVKPPKFTWASLEPGVQTEGKVVRLEKFGAFVDIGAESDGLVHISEMRTGRVNHPSDVVSDGDVIKVWVKEVDRRARRISLTMLEPPEMDIRSLKRDQVLMGKVVRLENFGAFVDVGAGRDGMIHVSEMGRGYVGQPSEIMSIGDELQVRVLEVDARRGRISLSMTDLPTESYSDQIEEELPTSMELALRAAMDPDDMAYLPKQEGRRRKKKGRKRRSQQDDIIYRTLGSHRDDL